MELLNKTNKLQILNIKHENKDSIFPETGDAIQSEKWSKLLRSRELSCAQCQPGRRIKLNIMKLYHLSFID